MVRKVSRELREESRRVALDADGQPVSDDRGGVDGFVEEVDDDLPAPAA